MASAAIPPISILAPSSVGKRVARRRKRLAQTPPSGQEPAAKKPRIRYQAVQKAPTARKVKVRFTLDTAVGPRLVYPRPMDPKTASQPMPEPPVLKKKVTAKKSSPKPKPKIKPFDEFESDPKVLADIEQLILDRGYDKKFKSALHREIYITRILFQQYDKYVEKLRKHTS